MSGPKRDFSLTLLLGAGLAAGCAHTEVSPERWPSKTHPIVIDRDQGTVRFAGIVPVVALERPMLEVLVCTPDSREHEALVMTRVRPSHLHAALLSLGAQPGRPGGLVWDGESFVMREPSGQAIEVRLAVEGSRPVWVDARSWFSTDPPADRDWRWLFTGSSWRGDRYAADTDGTIVGLVSFTTAVVGMSPAISEIDADRGFDFLPDSDRVPPFGTRVFVELRLSDGPD